MNVLMLTDKLTMGGAENYFIKLENKMTGSGFRFYTAAGGGELTDKISNKHNYMELTRKNHFLNLWRLTRHINKQAIDVIHANSLRMVLYAGCLRMLAFNRKMKIVYTKHNITSLETFPKLFSSLMNLCVTSIITVSEYEKRVLVQYGVQEDKITTVYNGVDLEKFPFTEKPQPEVFKVGILARLSPEKNHSLFLDIAATMKDEKDLHFYIAGEGPERESIQKKIQKLRISDRVTLLGEVQEPHQFIQSMDALLLTSEREVFPMVILEAMATGTPVITINRGGISEAIADGETGMMVNSHSVKAFCEKISTLKSNWELRKMIISAAHQKVVKNFTSKQMVTRTLKQY
ncbi:glycosyltransferase family 4 protein [Rossellomorea aquimaris]|jgi:glycosyltransferase involved in cell wall biosynthesis|uniref:glycosyltransferase family 4 protein n=1 Tax=Rossellomorea aquimaris TaxID=189382 RepID=UPI00249477A7|nr:glycosyltransferase family 4 protein [Rossellomorea aquimaris]